MFFGYISIVHGDLVLNGMSRFLKSADEIEERFPDFVVIRMYRAACADMKTRLSSKAGDIRSLLLRAVAAEAAERSKATKARFDAIIAKLREEPQVQRDRMHMERKRDRTGRPSSSIERL